MGGNAAQRLGMDFTSFVLAGPFCGMETSQQRAGGKAPEGKGPFPFPSLGSAAKDQASSRVPDMRGPGHNPAIQGVFLPAYPSAA